MTDGMTDGPEADRAAIAATVRSFFSAFASGGDVASRMEALRRLFLPGAVVVKTCGGEPVVYDVDGFIAPRARLLTEGPLADFSEWEISGRTEIFGDVAAHFCSYGKSGTDGGVPFAARGMKSLQLVRAAGVWRISAVAWDDERDGLVVPPR